MSIASFMADFHKAQNLFKCQCDEQLEKNSSLGLPFELCAF